MLLIATILLVMVAGGSGGATASAESPTNPTRPELATPTEGRLHDPGWWLVLAAQHVRGPSNKITLRAGSLTATEVSVQIRVKANVSEPVWFADKLYGATAWAHSGLLWHRVDTAEIRLMIALSLSAGEHAAVTLPLSATYQLVRVLIRTPRTASAPESTSA